VKLACSVSSVGNRPLAEALRLISQCGYRAVQLDWQQVVRQLPSAGGQSKFLAEMLSEHGLRVCSINAGAITAERDDQCQLQVRRLCEVLPLAAELRVPTINIAGGARSLENFNTLREAIRQLAEAASDSNVGVCLVNEIGSRVENNNDLAALFAGDGAGTIGLTLDAGQFHAAGVDSSEVVRQNSSRVRLVHITDMMGTTEVPIGHGEIEIRTLSDVLQEHDFGGYMVYRTRLYDHQQPDKYVREACQQLLPLLA